MPCDKISKYISAVFAIAHLQGLRAKSMAGHSKWANIKHRRGGRTPSAARSSRASSRKSRSRRAWAAAIPDANPRLRLAVDKAYDAQHAEGHVERAIKRGTGGLEGVNYEEIRYEGYGIGGAAVIVDCMTDNRTRTVADVRHAFTKYGGNLGTDGSVAFLFKHCGQFVFAPGTTKTS